MPPLITTQGSGPAPDPARGAASGEVVAGRYHIGAPLGAGGSGRVYLATDVTTGGEVAVKLIRPQGAAANARLRRELAALRLLRIPGVAPLLDHGVHGDEHFIALPAISGAPFPGPLPDGPPAARWRVLRPRTLALLEILHQIHAHGVVHRDLKPANVLVTADGVPMVLDFGIARGGLLGPTVTRGGELLGTPRYLAPEQIGGWPVDARADLYALGVMLYEAFVGEPPHAEDGGLDTWLARRVGEAAPPIATMAPGLEPLVCALVDRLLASNPAGRPSSAAEVLRALDGHVSGLAAELPPIGDPARVERLAAALRAGRPVSIWGPAGTGRSWLARQVAASCESAGRRVIWPRPADMPLGSLAGLVDDVADPAAAERSLRARLDVGDVVVADDVPRLDRFTRRLLLGLAERGGAILRVVDEPGAERTAPFEPRELRPLFAGPDRILHRAEDAAAELHARTRGIVARVVVELRGWVAIGLARWSDGRLVVEMEALRTLRAGFRSSQVPVAGGALAAPTDPALLELLAACTLAGRHADRALLARCTARPSWRVDAELEELSELGLVSIVDGGVRLDRPTRALPGWDASRWGALAGRVAEALPHGEERLRLLVDAGNLAGAVDEARVVAGTLGEDGQNGRAIGVLSYAWELARPAEGSCDAGARRRILHAWASLALQDGTIPTLRQLAAVLAEAADPETAPLATLVEAALLARSGAFLEAARLADACPVFGDDELEGHRLLVPARALLGTDPAEAERRILAVAEGPSTSPALRRRASGWLGHVRYRQCRFLEAGALHEAAADETDPAFRRWDPLESTCRHASLSIL